MSRFVLTERFLRDLASFRKSVMMQVDSRIRRAASSTFRLPSKDIRFGMTASVDVAYPSSGNTFEVTLGKPSFTETVGDQTLSFTAYDPVKVRIARTLFGEYIPVDTIVLLEKHHGQYYIKTTGLRLYRFTLTSGWSSGVADADIKQMDGSEVESAEVRDPELVFSALISGKSGYCLGQDAKYYAIQAPCA